jgi:hypothetical protein
MKRDAPLRAIRLAVVAAGLGLVTACLVDVTFSDARLLCSDGACPSGFACVEERCVPDEQGTPADAGDEPADAGADTDAGEAADAAPPDAAAPSDPDAAALPTCDEQYGGGPGYQLCAEEAGSCELFLLSEPTAPCSQHCADVGGGDCITAFNADPVDPCARQDETGCDSGNGSQICVCARGPATP